MGNATAKPGHVLWGSDMEGILSALITGGLALVGVIITNISSNRSMQSRLEKSQAVTDTKLDELTREVREHNGFARRMPVIEHEIRVINHRIEDLEFYHKPTGNGGLS